MDFLKSNIFWQKQPLSYLLTDDRVEIITNPRTDLWQKTYYDFANDNAPLLLTKSEELYFSFSLRVEYDYQRRFDQSGLVLYQDNDNWAKVSVEYENNLFQRLGSVVTNLGYSDWATSDISADIKGIYFRLSRRGSDFLFENSLDGFNYRQMRIFHLFSGAKSVNVGLYACSPEDSSFKAIFEEINFGECQWLGHI